MASEDVVDFAKLLAPIPGENPTGVDLRADPSPLSDYQKIKEDRKSVGQSERLSANAEKTDELSPPDWKPLIAKAIRLLSERSKDMEVTAWLVEGLTRERGFAGIRDGFRLARELLEIYWEGLFPLDSDPADDDGRFPHLLQLNGIDSPGTLIVPIRKIPLTEKTNEGCFSLAHHRLAISLDEISDPKVRQKKIDEGGLTLAIVKRAVAATPTAFYIRLVDDLKRAREEFLKFCEAYSEKAGVDAQSSDILGVLDLCLEVLKGLLGDRFPKLSVEKVDGATPGPAEPGSGSATREALGIKVEDPRVIRGRDDALERLTEIADFFRVHEPHSIIPFALEQVVAWGKMPLPELLAELIPEEGARKSLFKQVGIRPTEAKK